MDELIEPVESFMVQVRNNDQEDWVRHSEAVFGDSVGIDCPSGTTARLHTLDLSLLPIEDEPGLCAFARFSGTQNLPYSLAYEDWCVVRG